MASRKEICRSWVMEPAQSVDRSRSNEQLARRDQSPELAPAGGGWLPGAGGLGARGGGTAAGATGTAAPACEHTSVLQSDVAGHTWVDSVIQ